MTGPGAAVPTRRRARDSTRGQAGVLVLAAVVVGLGVASVALTVARAAFERARAQRVADTAALVGALRLARDPLEPRAAVLAARRVVEAARHEAMAVALTDDVLEVRVRHRAAPLGLPARFGGGAVLRVQAVARAAPGAPGDLLPAPALAHLDARDGAMASGTGPADPDGGGGGSGSVPSWVPARFRAALAAAAEREDLPVVLLAAQTEAESGFRPDAVSSAGAVGIAQFMPATWSGGWNPWRLRSPLEPGAALAAQGRYLRLLLDEHGGELRVALAAYNAGSARARRAPADWPSETRAYVARILARAASGGSGHGLLGAARRTGPIGARLVG